jgi:hypothetical protein
MKRLLATLVILALAISAHAAGFNSIPLTGAGGKRPPAAAGCSDANATAWAAAVVTAGGTVSAPQATRVCNLIVALKAHSLWTIQDRIWLHASENTQQSLIDIVNLGAATVVGAPNFTANEGWTGTAAATDYLDSNFNGASGPNFTQNSASVTSYVRSTGTFGACTVGVNESGSQTGLQPASFGNITFDVNNSLFTSQSTNAGNEQGVWTSSRTGASTIAVYHNSSATPFATASTASSATSPFDFFILAVNTDNTAVSCIGLQNTQISITAISAGTSAADTAQFQTDLNSYMTALGTNVY